LTKHQPESLHKTQRGQTTQPYFNKFLEVPQKKSIEDEKVQHVGIRQIIKQSSFTERCLCLFTLLLVVVGFVQYKTMDSQRKTMDSQLFVMRNDERAWVKIEPIAASYADPKTVAVTGQPLVFPLKVSNIGKTPAKKVEIQMRVTLRDSITGEPTDCRHSLGGPPCWAYITNWAIFFPNTDFTVNALRMTDNQMEWPVTDSEARAWEEGQMFLLVSGIAEYDDVFKLHHTYHFCFWVAHGRGTYHSKNCVDYNQVDDN
jgi:hypothetical protein